MSPGRRRRRLAAGDLFPCPPGVRLHRRDPERHGQGRGGPVRRRHPDRAHLRPGPLRASRWSGCWRRSRPRRAWCCTPSSTRICATQLEDGCRDAGHAADRGAGSAGRRPVALSGRGPVDPGGGPARAGHRLFQPHRRAGLRHGPRRRPGHDRAAGGRRRRPVRGQPHLQDPDLHLSGPPRHPRRQCAAGAGTGGRRAAGRAEEPAGRRA